MATPKKKKIIKVDVDSDAKMTEEEVEELKTWSDEDFDDPKKIEEHLAKKYKKKKNKDPFVRVEDVEKAMLKNGEAVDPETIVSAYIPRRRIRRLGTALLRMDKLLIAIAIAIVVIVIIFILAFSQEKMGNFTINLDRLELYRRGISIASDGNFTDPTARLTASAVEDATNMTGSDLPDNINDVDGDHNGRNYVAYTYYVRNAGKETLNYKATVTLTNASKGAEEAARVEVYKNDEPIIYAEPAADGGEEEGCVNFVDHELACEYSVENFEVGYVDKYTIVIWLEGNDPECTDDIVGGSMQFTMNIDAIEDDTTDLFTKFVQDIKDTFTGNKGIWSAGTDAPDYYSDDAITWSNRKNQ